MKAVLMSIHPKWCVQISNGIKTIELRKSYPKEFLKLSVEGQIFTPFKVYIYCTQPKTMGEILLVKSEENSKLFGYKSIVGINKGFRGEGDIPVAGTIIGEFICDKIDPYFYGNISYPTPAYEGDPSCCDCGDGYWITRKDLEEIRLTYDEVCEYGNGKTLYGWHISNLVIYDEPKQLSDFESYNVGVYTDLETGLPMPTHKIERAPQSWMYVRA